MKRTEIVTARDEGRTRAEEFLKETYLSQYQASIDAFPSQIIALVNQDDEIFCAAGLRTEGDGFFSERYLDAPIETVLREASGDRVLRSQIFEVSTFASRAPRDTARFIGDIVRFGRDNRFAWSFFTLTSRLRTMLDRLGLAPVCIGDADYRKLDDFEQWGRYYQTQPKVYAVVNGLRPIARSLSLRGTDCANSI